LVKKTWDVLAKNWKGLVVVALVPSAAAFVIGLVAAILGAIAVGVGAAGGINAAVIVIVGLIVLVAVVGMMYVGAWGSAALVVAVRETVGGGDIKVGDVLGKAKPLIWKYVWVMFIVSMVVSGGAMFLIVPAFIFSIWFFAAGYVVVEEGLGGMMALMKSKAYVSGHGLAVLGRMLVGMLILMGVGLVVGVVSLIPLVGWVVNILANVLLAPAVVIFSYLVFADLKKMAPVELQNARPVGGKKYIVIALVGIIIPILLIVATFVLVAVNPVKQLQKASQYKNEQIMNEFSNI
jgi:hypothetical protein